MQTEAEWEFAARGGIKSKGYQYCGSNIIDDVSWNENNAGDINHLVATRQPNELGIYDMSGSVWELCSDWYGTYNSEAQIDPIGPGSGSKRVRRGGGWHSEPRNCRSSYRIYSDPDERGSRLGIRLVLSK